MNFRIEINQVQNLLRKISQSMPRRNTKGRLLAILFIVGLTIPSFAQDTYTIYLVRHAEKEVSEDNPRDPGLTLCGQERAASIANFLDDVNIDVVYSTDYIRTKNTAEPTSKSKNKKIELYNPRELVLFAKSLIERSQDALVVGHSNTTGVLAGLLVGKKIASVSMTEDVYNRIYQVVICGDSKRLNLFQSAFVCKK